jgi:hypothetical protein
MDKVLHELATAIEEASVWTELQQGNDAPEAEITELANGETLLQWNKASVCAHHQPTTSLSPSTQRQVAKVPIKALSNRQSPHPALADEVKWANKRRVKNDYLQCSVTDVNCEYGWGLFVHEWLARSLFIDSELYISDCWNELWTQFGPVRDAHLRNKTQEVAELEEQQCLRYGDNSCVVPT